MDCERCGRREICFFDLCADCRSALGLPRSVGHPSPSLVVPLAISLWLAIWIFTLWGR